MRQERKEGQCQKVLWGACCGQGHLDSTRAFWEMPRKLPTGACPPEGWEVEVFTHRLLEPFTTLYFWIMLAGWLGGCPPLWERLWSSKREDMKPKLQLGEITGRAPTEESTALWLKPEGTWYEASDVSTIVSYVLPHIIKNAFKNHYFSWIHKCRWMPPPYVLKRSFLCVCVYAPGVCPFSVS